MAVANGGAIFLLKTHQQKRLKHCRPSRFFTKKSNHLLFNNSSCHIRQADRLHFH